MAVSAGTSRSASPLTSTPRSACLNCSKACPSTQAATTMPTASRSASTTRRAFMSIRAVVWRFFDDLHVMDVRFAHAGRGDFDELCLGVHVGDGGDAQIAHRGAQSAHQLMNHCQYGALVGHTALHSFGNQLLG